MTVAIVKSEKDHWTPQRRLFAGADPGRPSGRLPGGHVVDLADLKKAINLCPSCLPKFNATRHDYVRKPNLPFVRGRCDGCQIYMNRGYLLVHHTMADLR